MELAVFWLAVVGPILFGIATAVWYGGNRAFAIWFGFAGAVLLLAAAALQLQQRHATPSLPQHDDVTKAVAKSAEVAELTLRMSQGARVHIFEWASRNIEANKHPLFRARVANVGQSVATVIDDWSNLTVDATLPIVPTYGSHPVALLIPPGGGIFMEIDGRSPPGVLLTQPHIDELLAGKKNIFVWGRITIRDVFGEIWDLGYAVRFAPVKGDGGQVAWRDVGVDVPNYTFLTKRSASTPAPDTAIAD